MKYINFKFLIALLFLFVCKISLSQNNLIHNAVIEQPTNENTPFYHSLVDDRDIKYYSQNNNGNWNSENIGSRTGLSVWEEDRKEITMWVDSYTGMRQKIFAQLHSPDWHMYDDSDNHKRFHVTESEIVNGSYVYTDVIPHDGQGYLGLGPGELVEQKFFDDNKFESGKSYTLNFYIRTISGGILDADDYDANSGYYESQYTAGNNWSTGLDLKVFLKKAKMKYSISANLEKNMCDPDKYYEKTNNNYITVLSQHVDLNSYPPGQWHPITVEFIAPDDSYDWIIFETQSNSLCDRPYLLLDDFSLNRTCEEPSCDRLSGEVFPMHNGVINSATPLKITNLENAGDVLVEVFTQYGQTPIWSYSINCTNGINEPIYWDGKNNYGANVANALYVIKITSTNNCGTEEKTSSFVKNQDYDSSITNTIICNTSGVKTPIPCCVFEPDLIIDNITLPGIGLLQYKVISTIVVSPTNYVTVTNNADVDMKAGNEIILNPGFSVSPGGVYLAEIVPCHKSGKLRSSDIDPLEFDYSNAEDEDEYEEIRKISNEVLNKNVKVDVYPNPTDSKLNISFENISSGDYELFSIDGRLILKDEFKNTDELQIDLSSNKSGVYFIKLNINGEIISKKIIKD